MKSTTVRAIRICLGLVWSMALSFAAGAAQVDRGEAIYRHGILSSGAALVGWRDNGVRMEGAEAACGNCHRRSGLGAKEGRGYIPPVSGPYLFHSRAHDPEQLDLPYVEGMQSDREPYSDATLARAIRQGVGSDGRSLSYLMPHFDLPDEDMSALIAYLKSLDRRKVRGVSDSVLHFATIITPDADPIKRRGMLDVLERYFEDKNNAVRGPAPRMYASRKMMFRVTRRWQLHVWELSGPPDTWQRQLDERMAKEPVFAAISGLGGNHWEPVHAFCEAQALPCLFPNVMVPVDSREDFYSLYFSKGILLEAGTIARKVLDSSDPRPTLVHQIFRSGDTGVRGAQALEEALRGSGIQLKNLEIGPGQALKTLPEAIAAANTAEVLVLWLRGDDLAALDGAPPASASVVLASGLLGGMERAPLSAVWREQTRLTYPVDLPDRRRVRVDYALGWFYNRKIPVVSEQVQADTFLTCGLVSETLNHMVDTFVPEYLVERLQDQIGHRVITGYYPRLTLANGQHFASKGAYLVRFAEPNGTRIVADTEWSVP